MKKGNRAKKTFVKLHRELWNWLWHHPKKTKGDWPGWRRKDVDSVWHNYSYCFPCAYTEQVNKDCEACPVIWPGKEGDCIDFAKKGDSKGIYSKWAKSSNPRTRKKYAAMIRDLPEKK